MLIETALEFIWAGTAARNGNLSNGAAADGLVCFIDFTTMHFNQDYTRSRFPTDEGRLDW